MPTSSGPDQPSGHSSPASFPPPDPAAARPERSLPRPTAPQAQRPDEPTPIAVAVKDQTGEYASFAPRFAAFAVDAVLAIVAGIVVAVVVGYAVRYITFFAPAVRIFSYGTMIGIYLFQSYVQGETGQTLGKRLVGTRLVNLDSGLPIGAMLSVRRGLFHALDALPCGFGFFQVIWHTRHQTFADMLSRSVVVHG